jgi:hypothetical protein
VVPLLDGVGGLRLRRVVLDAVLLSRGVPQLLQRIDDNLDLLCMLVKAIFTSFSLPC